MQCQPYSGLAYNFKFDLHDCSMRQEWQINHANFLHGWKQDTQYHVQEFVTMQYHKPKVTWLVYLDLATKTVLTANVCWQFPANFLCKLWKCHSNFISLVNRMIVKWVYILCIFLEIVFWNIFPLNSVHLAPPLVRPCWGDMGIFWNDHSYTNHCLYPEGCHRVSNCLGHFKIVWLVTQLSNSQFCKSVNGKNTMV